MSSLQEIYTEYFKLKCYDICNLLSEVSERETNVGKMSITDKWGSLGKRYVYMGVYIYSYSECPLYD